MEGPAQDIAQPAEARPVSLYDLDRQSLSDLIEGLDEPRFRADQLWHWLYRRAAASFDEMHNLPASLRQRLQSTFDLHTITPVTVTTSRDKQADKLLFELIDGQLVEAVLMHYEDPADSDTGIDQEPADAARGRHTACLSTQAGCAMGCTFCATGQMGLMRDLTAGEVVEQAVHVSRMLRASGRRLSNVVFMGMGEPLANLPATIHTIGTLTDPSGFAIGARRITVSTIGLPTAIDRLAAAGKQVRLAVSLHAPDDELRSRLVAVNDTYSIASVLAACRRYQASGGRRITFEYVLIRDVNDRIDQANALAMVLQGIVAHVNLIPLNPTSGSDMKPSKSHAVIGFKRALEARGVASTARLRRGIDIDAGCGQLRSRVMDGRMGRTVGPAGGTTSNKGETT